MKKDSEDIYPHVNAEGSIFTNTAKAVYETAEGYYNGDVRFEKLQYAYLIVNPDQNTPYPSILVLFDYQQHKIPTNIKGFKELYQLLSGMYDLDDNSFFKHVNSKEKIKKQIWRRVHETNFSIIENNSFSGIDEGFAILSPENDFIKWDTTYAEVAKNINTILTEDKDGQKIIKFNYPVQAGNLIIEDLHIFLDGNNLDTPIMKLHAKIYYKNEGDKSYYELKNALLKTFGSTGNINENSGQNHFSVENNGINFSITYTYDSEGIFESGCTSLSILNQREYPYLSSDKEYEKIAAIDKFITFGRITLINARYKTNKRIKKSSAKIKELFNKSAAMWLDNINNKIGFSAQQYSMVFNKDEIRAINIQKSLPGNGKGWGETYLNLLLTDGTIQEIFTGSRTTFDCFIEQIKELTSKEIIVEQNA